MGLREAMGQMYEMMSDFGEMMNVFEAMMGDIRVVMRRPRRQVGDEVQPEQPKKETESEKVRTNTTEAQMAQSKQPDAKPNMAKAQAAQTKSLQAKPDSRPDIKAKAESEIKMSGQKAELDKHVDVEMKRAKPDKYPGTETRQPQRETETPKPKRKLKFLGRINDQSPLEMEELCRKAENLNLHLCFWRDAKSGKVVAELSTFRYTVLGKIYQNHLCGNILGSPFCADDELTIEADDQLITGYFNYQYARLYNLLLSLFVGMADKMLGGAVREFGNDYEQCQDDAARTRACAVFLTKATKLLNPKKEINDNDADLTASEKLIKQVIAKVMSAEPPWGMFIGSERLKPAKLPELLAFNSLAPMVTEQGGALFNFVIDGEDWIAIKALTGDTNLIQNMEYSEKYWNELAERLPGLESRMWLGILHATETAEEEVFLVGKFNLVAILQVRQLLSGVNPSGLALSLENQLFYELCRGIFDYLGMIDEVRVSEKFARGMRSVLTGKEEVYRFGSKLLKLALVRDLKSELLARPMLDARYTVNMLAMLFRYYGISLCLQEATSGYVCTVGLRLWWGNVVMEPQRLKCATAEELYEELFAILFELTAMC